jgi:hypothetical protein
MCQNFWISKICARRSLKASRDFKSLSRIRDKEYIDVKIMVESSETTICCHRQCLSRVKRVQICYHRPKKWNFFLAKIHILSFGS